MSTKAKKKNRFMRFITGPIRALYRARDCYVGSMNDFADRGRYGNISGPAAIPRSFSVSSTVRSDESEDQRQVRELIRALSTKSAPTTMGSPSPNDNINLDLYVQQMRKSAAMGSTKVPRSCSVGMGKIDEESPSDLGEHSSHRTVNLKPELVYPRSRSYAVPQRKVVF